MQAMTLFTDHLPLPSSLRAWPEKTQTICKAMALALPILAVAAAAYAAPITVTLASLGALAFSITTVKQALNGSYTNHENAIRMILVSLIIAGIAFGGLGVGLTPLFTSTLLNALKAPTYGVMFLQLASRLMLLTGLWGTAGGISYELLTNAGKLPVDRLTNYLVDLKNKVCVRTLTDQKNYGEVLFIALRKFSSFIPIRMTDAIYYLCNAKELESIIDGIMNAVASMGNSLPGLRDQPNTRTLVARRMEPLLKQLSKAISKLPESEQRNQIKGIMERLSPFGEFREFNGVIQNFTKTYIELFRVELAAYLSEDPEAQIVTFKSFLEEFERNFNEKGNVEVLGKKIFEIRKNLEAQLKTNTFLKKWFPNDADLAVWGIELLELNKKIHEISQKIEDFKGKSMTSTRKIDPEDTVWNLLLTNAQWVENTREVIKKLKELLGCEDMGFDSKLEELGLGSVKALLEKKDENEKSVFTESDFLGDTVKLQEKIFAYIEECVRNRDTQSIDLSTRISQTLDHLKTRAKDPKFIQDVAYRAIYHLTMAFSIFVPLVIAPKLFLFGLVVGTGIGIYKSLQTGQAASLNNFRMNLIRQSQTSIKSRLLLNFAARTLIPTDALSQQRIREFSETDLLEKARHITSEMWVTTCLGILAWIPIVNSFAIPFLGGYLSIDIVEAAYPTVKNLLKKNIKFNVA